MLCNATLRFYSFSYVTVMLLLLYFSDKELTNCGQHLSFYVSIMKKIVISQEKLLWNSN